MSEVLIQQNNLSEAVSYLKNYINETPKIAIVLGSGLSHFAEQLSDKIIIDNNDIPNYPKSTVVGHSGKIIFGRIKDNKKTSPYLCCFQGRVHLYESGNIKLTSFPIDVAFKLGVETLIITNAAGGINKNYHPGDLMLIKDFLNLTFSSPLRGFLTSKTKSNSFFSQKLIDVAKNVASENKINLQEGVYCWTKGPCYETASEIKMMNFLGADAVGMSTTPEVMKANYYGMEVLGISCITNMGTGISKQKLAHSEVTEVANKVKEKFTTLMKEIILSIDSQ